MSKWLDWLKKPIYAVAKQDSDNMEGIGRALGWDWLTEEAQRNQKNPGRAIGKAAASAASIYAGGLLGGAGGGAGSAAGNAAGNAAVTSGNAAANAALTAADYEAMLAAQQIAAQQAAQQSAGLLGPQGFANTMEAGMTDTGYTPSTAFNALKNGPGSNQGLLGSLGKWASNAPKGMSAGDAKMGLMGMQMMQGEPEQRQPMPPPPPAAPPPQSTFTGYGDQPPPGIDPMTWAQMPDYLKKQLMMGRAA